MNAQLTTRLRHLRLSGMVETLPGRVAQAEAAPLAHLEFLELLVEDEFVQRADRLFARRLKQAGIVTITTLADFDWSFNPKLPKAKLVALASARFVQTHDGVLVDRSARCRQITHGDSAHRSARFAPVDASSSAARLTSRRTSPRPTPPDNAAPWCNTSRASTCSSSRISA